MHLNPFAISNLLIIIFYLPLSILLFIKGKTKLARIYSLHIFAIVFWGIGAFLIGISQEPNFSLILWKFTYASVLFIPVYFCHSILLMTANQNRFVIFFVYAQAIYFVYSILTGKMMASVRLVFNSFYFHVGTPTFFVSAIIWIVIASYGFIELISHYKNCYPEQKNQIRLLIFTAIAWCGGATNFLPGLGMNIYPSGNFLVPILSIIITYAVLKHQLLEIEIVFKRSIVYSILIAFISIAYLVLVVFTERLFQSYFGYQSITFTIFTAFFIGVLFIPLRNRIQSLVDRLFFKATPTEMAEEIKLLHREVQETEKFKTVATLASGVVHEVKNPLTTIRTMAEYLPQKMHDPKFVEQFSRLVPQEIDRIDAMIHELLQFARPSPPKLEPTNLYELLNSTLGFLSSNFTRHKINVQKDYEDIKDRPFLLDANQIKQVVLNLFLNAIDAMPQGGTLKVGGRVRNPSVVISITDTGCGIASEDLKHIFEAFFTKKEKGTGLGLAVTKNIIEEHGGTISVKSKVGEGTTFTLELPINRDKRES